MLYILQQTETNRSMKFTSLFFVLLLVATLTCKAQDGAYLHTRYSIDRLFTNTIGNYSGAPLKIGNNITPGTEGHVYFSDQYNLSVFQLYDDQKLIEGVFSKLDLKNNEFDIQTKSGVKVLKGDRVKSFIYEDSVTTLRHNFVNAKEWKTREGTSLDGFFEVLSHGDVVLASYTELEFIPANYNVARDIGNKYHQYVKKVKHYYIKNSIVSELPKKKEFFEIFGEKKDAMQKYSEEHRLSIKSGSDLKKLFDYYNQPAVSRPD